ncbi:MAG TPA: hypothetical protein VFT06_03045 [Flavisolibacter sp.]|nr:hypothetical protein [Flavisolibacter sp.]
MKKQKSGVVLAFLTLCFVHASAQEPVLRQNNFRNDKTRIFADLPEKMPLRVADAESLLDLPIDSRVNATLATGFSVVGAVVSKSDPADPRVKSVVIRTNRQGAVFTFTRIKAADGSMSYIGRMFDKSGGDALEIAREGQGYVIRKKGINELVNE